MPDNNTNAYDYGEAGFLWLVMWMISSFTRQKDRKKYPPSGERPENFFESGVELV